MQDLKTPLIFFVVTAAISYACFHIYLGQKAQFDWPTTKAIITKVEEGSTSGQTRNLQTLYVRYEYEIDGVKYEGFDNPNDELGDWSEVVSQTYETAQLWTRWKAKKDVTIHYNPDDPTESDTKPDSNGWLIVGGIVAGLLSLLGLAGVYTAVFGKQ